MPGVGRVNAPFAPKRTEALNWSHRPSPFAWSVLIYGGKNPRTGMDQPQVEVQFHKRTRAGGTGYGTEGILYRANYYAVMQYRSHFAVRDTDGSVIYDGPVLDEIDVPRVFGLLLGRVSDAELVALSRVQQQHGRNGGVA
jgi:hypothetical protein